MVAYTVDREKMKKPHINGRSDMCLTVKIYQYANEFLKLDDTDNVTEVAFLIFMGKTVVSAHRLTKMINIFK